MAPCVGRVNLISFCQWPVEHSRSPSISIVWIFKFLDGAEIW